MEIYCKDYDGQDILNPSLTQWDTGQMLYVTGLTYNADVYDDPWFHFGNKQTAAVIRTQAASDDNGDTWYAPVPDTLLQEPYTVNVYVYLPAKNNSGVSKTAFKYELPVQPRPRPDGVVVVEPQYEYVSMAQLKAELMEYIDSKLS